MVRRIMMVGFTRPPKTKPHKQEEIASDLAATLNVVEEKQEEELVPQLPTEVLALALDKLDNIQDICNVAQVCQEWRALIHSLDACWEKAFLRDFGERNVEDYASIPSWRDKYIASSLDVTCICLREKATIFDDLEDTTAALERSVQSILSEIQNLEETYDSQVLEFNQRLAYVSGTESTNMGSELGKTIISAAEMEGERVPGAQEGSEWEERLTPEVCREISQAYSQVKNGLESIRERKDALKTMIEALKVQQASTHYCSDKINVLRVKRASLEAATQYRSSMRI